MENISEKLEPVFNRIEAYARSGFELVKIQSIGKSATILSDSIANWLGFMFVAVMIFMSNIGLAIYLGVILNEMFLGFFIVAGGYGVLGLIYHIFIRKYLRNYLANRIVSKLMN